MHHLTISRLLMAAFFAAMMLATSQASAVQRRKTTPANPFRFNDCYGTVISQAINEICTKWEGVSVGTAHYDPGVQDTVTYTPTPGTAEQGKIYFEIDGLDNAGCPRDININYDSCIYNFWVPINQCNQGSADGKQGGVWLDSCLEFIIIPNPDGC
ncbi:hypothetical protein LTR85_002029 [Meristemomyces frigidus]|nr:hypothetical protein LTR85_002029 [Meristemomyces frigidus]